MTESEKGNGIGRRDFLALGGTSLTSIVAGCSQQAPTTTNRGSLTPSGTPSPSPSSTETSKLSGPLSVDASHPFVYLNDQNDNYNAELALAMASSGAIELRGFIFGYAGEPWLSDEQLRKRIRAYRSHHRTVHDLAKRSGFSDLPPAEIGIVGDRHERPDSGLVEDTQVIGSEGTDRIVNAARQASRYKPLVLAVGCDLCTVADAYLADPSIADQVVVFVNWKGVADSPGYNILQSGWSGYVVLDSLRTVLVGKGAPLLNREQIESLPDEPLPKFMLNKTHPVYGSPLEGGKTWDGDSAPLLAAAHPKLIIETESVALTGLTDPPFKAEFQVPELEFTSNDAKLTAVTESGNYTRLYWKHLQDPDTFG